MIVHTNFRIENALVFIYFYSIGMFAYNVMTMADGQMFQDFVDDWPKMSDGRLAELPVIYLVC